MDIIDKVTYDFTWDSEKDLSEETRRAFIEVFDPTNDNAILVARFLVQICKWEDYTCLLYTSPSPRDRTRSRMPSSA